MPDMIIPSYRIIREIGQGGMAVVYLAVQESLHRNVALKVMSPVLLAADKTFGDRFLKEGRTVAQLRHSGIVQVYDIGASEDSFYMAMEYISGGDLAGRIRRGMSEGDALNVLRQVAEALGYAHGKGFVHRDIKPENVLFDDDGRVVLTDFGIAKAMRSGTKMTRAGMSIGTPQYMSPEQARGKGPVDGRSDLYSLGVVFHEMLTGNVPYDAEDTYAIGLMHISAPLPTLPPTLSKYQPLVERLMAKDPADRFAEAGELLAALDIRASGSVTSGPKPRKHEAPRPSPAVTAQRDGHRMRWALGGVLLALLVFGLMFGVLSRDPTQRVASGGGVAPPPLVRTDELIPPAPDPMQGEASDVRGIAESDLLSTSQVSFAESSASSFAGNVDLYMNVQKSLAADPSPWLKIEQSALPLPVNSDPALPDWWGMIMPNIAPPFIDGYAEHQGLQRIAVVFAKEYENDLRDAPYLEINARHADGEPERIFGRVFLRLPDTGREIPVFDLPPLSFDLFIHQGQLLWGRLATERMQIEDLTIEPMELLLENVWLAGTGSETSMMFFSADGLRFQDIDEIIHIQGLKASLRFQADSPARNFHADFSLDSFNH